MKNPGIVWRFLNWFFGTKLGAWVERRLNERCEKCPLQYIDNSEYHQTGYIEAYCGAGKRDMLCAYPKVYRIWKQKKIEKAERKRIDAENAYLERLWREEQERRREDPDE